MKMSQSPKWREHHLDLYFMGTCHSLTSCGIGISNDIDCAKWLISFSYSIDRPPKTTSARRPNHDIQVCDHRRLTFRRRCNLHIHRRSHHPRIRLRRHTNTTHRTILTRHSRPRPRRRTRPRPLTRHYRRKQITRWELTSAARAPFWVCTIISRHVLSFECA